MDASHWFGQCWSACKESALMWQAFKKNKEPYVKIKSKRNFTRIIIIKFMPNGRKNISVKYEIHPMI